MERGAWELESIGKLVLYLLLLVVLIGLIYFFRDILYDKFEIIKNLVRLG